ncbi:MAG: lipoate--protein ligase family protein [Ardenticatenales bacterium]|nr:lipoate--protein ligase family protein [Ardenticatenales bacterium]
MAPQPQQPKINPADYEPASWRLLITGLRRGPENMAIDEAILEAVAAGEAPPTLRFYGWEPACLSLGYAQEAELVDFDACEELGWDVVRRTTGGRAILHVDELTYSVCAPAGSSRVKGDVIESYQRLSLALVAGLKLMGLNPERAKPYYQDAGAKGPACFDGPSNYEIMVGGRKLIGSAQVRRHGMVMQHGTLPLAGDITRIAKGLYVDYPGQRMAIENRLRFRATTLLQSGGQGYDFARAADTMAQGFAQALNLTLEPGELTAKELARAAELEREKYASSEWTERI